MSDLDTAKTWQTKLDANFPHGAKCMLVDDVPEDQAANITFDTPRLMVSDAAGGVVTIWGMAHGMNKDFTARVDSVLEDEPGRLHVSENDGQEWVFTDNVGERIAKEMQQVRNDNPSIYTLSFEADQ